MKLSDGEKLILLMLVDLYRNLKIRGEFDPDFISETIHSDQLWGFEWQYSGIPFEREATPPIVKQTVDVLDMWSFLEEGYAKLSPADKARLEKDAAPFGKDAKFAGFDANNEDHYGVAHYLINHLGRFSRFKTRALDSHMPVIDVYLRMFSVFEPIRATLINRSLNADEIIAILKERVHPSKR